MLVSCQPVRQIFIEIDRINAEIAKTREIIAASQALLNQPMPKTLLGLKPEKKDRLSWRQC